MTDSDDDTICIDTSTKSGIKDDEIQQYIDLIVVFRQNIARSCLMILEVLRFI